MAELVPCIDVRVNREEKTIRFIDNGIGMTADEVDQYINRIAFSGATDFIEKFQGQNEDNQIIGHFGLGFYSAFMVADRVTISTLSYQPGTEPVFWDCDGSMQFSMQRGDRSERGSEITLYLSQDSQFLRGATAERIIRKYFEFLPIEIYLSDDGPDETDAQGRTVPAVKDKLVNDPYPLWTKKPEECTDEEYINFYRMAFRDLNSPVYWIHLYDEEQGVRGIIYFKSEETMNREVDGLVRLYSNQVFVADNVKEIVPDFLLLQYGVLDCSNLPLMVSRSSLHEDERIRQLEQYITEQITYRLYGLFSCEREKYEEMWAALNPFMKYSCLKNKLFSSYVNKFIIFETLNGDYVTLQEHLDAIKDKHANHIFYVSDEIQQAQFVKIYRESGIDALMMTHVIDTPYIRKEEMQNQDLRFDRVDAAFCDALRDPEADFSEEKKTRAQETLEELYRDNVSDFEIDLAVELLVCTDTASLVIIDEEERRMQETVELYSAYGVDVSQFKEHKDTLLLNYENHLVRFLTENPQDALAPMICCQLYDLGRLGQETLEAEDMVAFIERSNQLLQMISLGAANEK